MWMKYNYIYLNSNFALGNSESKHALRICRKYVCE